MTERVAAPPTTPVPLTMTDIGYLMMRTNAEALRFLEHKMQGLELPENQERHLKHLQALADKLGTAMEALR